MSRLLTSTLIVYLFLGLVGHTIHAADSTPFIYRPAFRSRLQSEYQCWDFPPSPRQLHVSNSHRYCEQEILNSVSKFVASSSKDLLRFSHTVPLLGQRLSAETDVVIRDSSPDSGRSPSPLNRLGGYVALKGNMVGMSYGAGFGYFGKDSHDTRKLGRLDRSGANLFWEAAFHNWKPRVEVSRYVDNLEEDSTKPRTVTTSQRLSVDWSQNGLSSLTFTYGHDYKEIQSVGTRPTTHTENVNTFNATFSVGRSFFDSYLKSQNVASGHTTNQDANYVTIGSSWTAQFQPVERLLLKPKVSFSRTASNHKERLNERYVAKLASSVRLFDFVAIKPTLAYVQLFDRITGVRTETIDTKWAYSYSNPQHALSLSVFGGLKIHQDSKELTNLHTYDFSFSLEKNLQDILQFTHRRQALQFNITHNQQINYLDRPSSSGNTSAMLLIRITP